MNRFSFNAKPLCMALAVSILLLSVSSCARGPDRLPTQTDFPAPSDDPSDPSDPGGPTDSEAPSEPEKKQPGLPVTFTIEPPMRSLRAGKLQCAFTGVRLADSLQGLSLGDFRDDANICSGGRSLRNPEFIGEDGIHFVPGVYLLLVDVTVTSQGAESCTRRDRDDIGNPKGQFDDPYLFRADDLIFVVDLAPELTTQGLYGAYFMDYFSGMGRRGESPVVFRLEPGESVEFTVGFLVSDIRQSGDTHFDFLYLADGAVHDVKDTLLHLELDGEEALKG